MAASDSTTISSSVDALKPRVWPATPIPSREAVEKIIGGRRGDFGLEHARFIESTVHWKDVMHKPEALTGMRVIDAGIWRLSNSFASSLLGELGAEVIKIEPPKGDPFRTLVPFGREEYLFKDTKGEPCGPDFVAECRNKYSVTLNLETPEGQEYFRQLAAQADVVFEDYPPGYFDKLGIGYRQLSKLNPRLVYCWLGILGQWGPMKDRVSKHGQWMLEPFAQAADSFVHNTGFPQDLLPRGKGGDPTRSGVWIGDYVAGTQAVVNTLAALYYREEVSGKGQFIEVTSAEALLDILDFDISWYGFNKSIKSRTGGWDPNLNQYAWNPCKDGFMMIGGQTDRLWYRIGMCIERDIPEFGRLMGEDPFLKEIAARNAFHGLTKTYTLTSMWLRNLTRAQAEAKLVEYEVAAGPVMYLDEVTEYPQFKYRGWVEVVDDENYGPTMVCRPPLGYQHRTPARTKWVGRPLGLDTEEIFRKYLGMGPQQVQELREKGVV